MAELTHSYLKNVLKYNPYIESWIRKIKTSNSAKLGLLPIITDGKGYRIISINSRHYPSARLAWFYMEGYWPENEIDHINRIKDDDRWKNLRHVSRQCNMRNTGIPTNNTSGVKGVTWSKQKNRWQAQIKINGKNKYQGRYINFIDAVKARWNAELKYNFPNCQTNSPSYLYLKENCGLNC